MQAELISGLHLKYPRNSLIFFELLEKVFFWGGNSLKREQLGDAGVKQLYSICFVSL